jgi:hypothetical protein
MIGSYRKRRLELMATRDRLAIEAPDVVGLAGLAPLANVSRLAGVRVFDVGQGDSIAIMGVAAGELRPVLQLDYGGRERNPFGPGATVDQAMPVESNRLLMLSHWDEDHWCSAPKGSSARAAEWLVPRQLTSPRAVMFSTDLPAIHCIPEALVGEAFCFDTSGGDHVAWEKIGAFPGAFARGEDCNKTGVALAVVHYGGSGAEAILLPGDAPFDKVGLFRNLFDRGVTLRGIVAFHHGAGTHWTQETERLLKDWPAPRGLDVVFSCSDPSSYHHPDEDRYKALLPDATLHWTSKARAANHRQVDLAF